MADAAGRLWLIAAKFQKKREFLDVFQYFEIKVGHSEQCTKKDNFSDTFQYIGINEGHLKQFSKKNLF